MFHDSAELTNLWASRGIRNLRARKGGRRGLVTNDGAEPPTIAASQFALKVADERANQRINIRSDNVRYSA